MNTVRLLSSDWRPALAELVRSARRELLICVPYVSEYGVRAVLPSLSDDLRGRGRLVFVTDLSSANIACAATNPDAVRELAAAVAGAVYHLPRVHAKVYAADDHSAIITSGNLTYGGLVGNHEYGVCLSDLGSIRRLVDDIRGYASLGGVVTAPTLADLCEQAKALREEFDLRARYVPADARERARRSAEQLENALLRARLAGDSFHGILARTIRYLLAKHGPLRTAELHPLIQAIHPDLCDDAVDRVIDGQRFGKLWKHAARTAQQHLKKEGTIQLAGGRWRLTQPPAR